MESGRGALRGEDLKIPCYDYMTSSEAQARHVAQGGPSVVRCSREIWQVFEGSISAVSKPLSASIFSLVTRCYAKRRKFVDVDLWNPIMCPWHGLWGSFRVHGHSWCALGALPAKTFGNKENSLFLHRLRSVFDDQMMIIIWSHRYILIYYV